MTRHILPTPSAKPITVNGRSYTPVVGTPHSLVPDQDAFVLCANGYLDAAGDRSVGSGTTANRPTTGLVPGSTYHDSTLGYVVVYDGATWRHQSTGASA